jgi:hypothetical protein
MNPSLRLPQRIVSSCLVIAVLPWLLVSCGGDSGGGGSATIEQEIIKGQVFDGHIEGAVVCADANGNGRCDEGEAQTASAAGGSYELTVAKGYAGPLVAEVIAGRSRDSDEGGAGVDRSYRMASPARGYSTDITPFTTLVRLTGFGNFGLAEDLARNELGLPPKFEINLSAAPAAGSRAQAVAKSVVTALKATPATLDYSAPDALAKVVAAFPGELTTLPVLRIDTKDAAPIVSKEIYVNATFVLTDPASGGAPIGLNGKVRGRGHTTWGQPKNPYKVQFANDASYASVTDFLGMKKNRNWALLADYFDRSLLRNKLVLSLGSSSVFSDGMKWNPVGQHVEVRLNGDYIGVYLLSEDIRIASSRLNIKEMSNDPATNDTDGGYIVEVDFRLDCYNVGALNLQLVTPQNVPICIDTPDEGAITPSQLTYIKNLLTQVEQELYGSRRIDGINAASFVDWYLVQELFKNNDGAFVSSDFMWKDTAAAATPSDRLLNMGPLWDFDRSAGNLEYAHLRSPEGCWVNTPSNPNWFSRIFDNPDFLDLTISRWKQKRPALETLINAGIDTFTRRLDAAQRRNFERWPLFEAHATDPYVLASHADEVAYLKQFLNDRMAWLDRAFASREAFAALCR